MSRRAVSGVTPSASRNCSTRRCRSRERQRQRLPRRGEERPAIRLLRDEPVLGEPLQHLGDGRLRNAEPGRDVDLPRLAAVLDEVGDQLDIILGDLGAPRALVLLMRRRDIMGDLVNRPLTHAAAIGGTILISCLNLVLILQVFDVAIPGLPAV